jgi:arginine decarboxylase
MSPAVPNQKTYPQRKHPEGLSGARPKHRDGSAAKERTLVDIVVTQGQGTGRTPTSAFDAALLDAGIGNYNLVRTGSAIPPGSSVTATRFEPARGQWGNRLYVTLASGVAIVAHTEMWAGVGWVQASDGRGLLVRHSDSSQENVVNEIQTALNDMAGMRKDKFGPVRYVLQHVKCLEEPVCAVVAAVFRAEAWLGNGNGGGPTTG